MWVNIPFVPWIRHGLCKGCPPPKVEQRAKTPEISDGKGRRSPASLWVPAIFQGRTAARLPGGYVA